MKTTKTKGCVHIQIKKGKIVNVFSHISNFPKNCIVHMKPDHEYTDEEFLKSHPQDENELKAKPEKSIYDLRDKTL